MNIKSGIITSIQSGIGYVKERGTTNERIFLISKVCKDYNIKLKDNVLYRIDDNNNITNIILDDLFCKCKNEILLFKKEESNFIFYFILSCLLCLLMTVSIIVESKYPLNKQCIIKSK